MPNRRTPNNVHRLNGTYRPDRHAGGDFEPDSEIPERPEFLTGNAALEWDRIVKLLEPYSVVTAFDLAILTQYCALYGEFADNPTEFRVGKHTQLRLLSGELGWTPASRHRVDGFDKGEDPKKNPFSEL